MDQEFSPYIRCVMNYFSCNKKMAETILRSSKQNGEFEKIKNMCLMSPTERNVRYE